MYGHIRHVSSNYSSLTGLNQYVGREFLRITDVDKEEWFDAELILGAEGIGVIVNDIGSFIKREDIFDPGSVKTSYRRSGYFGGNECPPHKMEIDVENIRGDNDRTNWQNGACEKTYSRSIFYNYEDLNVDAARTITFSEEVYRGQYNFDDFLAGDIPAGYNVGDEIPWSEIDGNDGGGRYVIVESGSDLTLRAGERITFKTGTHIEAGADFKAEINNSIACANFQFRPPNPNGPNLPQDMHAIGNEKYNDIISPNSNDNNDDDRHSADLDTKAGNFNVNPNPFTDYLEFKFKLTKPDIVKIDLFDINGKLLAKLINQNFHEGTIYINRYLSHSELKKGIYICVFQTSDAIYRKKIIKTD